MPGTGIIAVNKTDKNPSILVTHGPKTGWRSERERDNLYGTGESG